MSNQASSTDIPAIVDIVGAGKLLGLDENSVSIGVAKGLIPLLGKPARNARRFFWTNDILMFRQDRRKCDRLIRALYDRNRERNGTAHQSRDEAQH